MSAVPTDSIQSRVVRHLDPHGSEGARTALSGVVDLEALEKREYGTVLAAVEQRLSQARYSLLSMILAGIYFGLLVGFWLIDGSTWKAISLWAVPVLLVSTYGTYATHQTILQIRHLAQARALLRLLTQRSSREAEPDDA